jgi:DNA-binding transcriptional LysR family regulator
VVKLSALGQIYYEQVKDIVSGLDNADDLVSQRSKVPSGVIRITAMHGYGTLVLQPVLEQFRQIYPEIILDVELTDYVADITQNEVDIAIRASTALPERAIARKLSDNRFVMIASPEYIKINGLPMHTEDLLHHQTLIYRGPNGILHWQAKTKGIWRELRTNPVYISNNGIALMQAAIAGQGIALLPKWGVASELESGALRELKMKETQVSVTRALESGIYLLYLKPRYGILKIKVAVDFLVDELSHTI